jgi:hypothetical protein
LFEEWPALGGFLGKMLHFSETLDYHQIYSMHYYNANKEVLSLVRAVLLDFSYPRQLSVCGLHLIGGFWEVFHKSNTLRVEIPIMLYTPLS